MYPLVETIKVLNGKIYNLQYHQKRLEFSFDEYFNKKPVFLLQNVITIPENFSEGLVKLRFLYNKNDFNLDFSNYTQPRINTLKVIEDNEITYSLKFTDRSQINRLLNQKGVCDDILIVKNDFITDTSIANIVFYEDKEWVTPARPLLKGTCRDKLLKDGKIREETIKLNDLYKFKYFGLINAMNCGDFVPISLKNIHHQIPR